MKAADESILDKRCTRHGTVRVDRMIYPSKAADVKRTCMFVGDDGNKYRLEPATSYRKHALGHGVSEHERMGGFDRFHTYTIWTDRTIRDQTGNDMHYIYYAKPEPQELTSDLIADMLAQTGRPRTEAKSLGERVTWKILRPLLKKDTLHPVLKHLVANVPYFKMRLSRRLFRLFSQSRLMELSLEKFLDIAKRLMEINGKESASKVVASLSFSWLQPDASYPVLDIQGLFALGRHYAFASMSGLGDVEWRALMLCVELFQKALAHNKRGGHTYSNFRELAIGYLSAIGWDEKTKPSICHIIEGAPAPNQAMVAEALSSHATLAIKLGIVVVRAVPIDESKPRVRANMARVVYAADDWMMQNFVAQSIEEVVTVKWIRSRHADGCKTPEDVRAKITHGKPPKHPTGPQWNSAAFQARWRDKLDEKQKRAVINAVLRPVSFVTGPPGTGKTELFVALKELFPDDKAIGLAAYGRIANMLDSRIGDGFTFHRAEAIGKHRADSAIGERILKNRMALFDEFGLMTHDHLTRFFAKIGAETARLVLAGDVDQLGAIGSGSIIGSIYSRYSECPEVFTELDIPHRFLPNHGVGMRSEEIRQLMATKPTSAADPMCVPWNMRQVHDYPKTGKLDLVVGDSPEDRFVVVPEGATVAETVANLARVGVSIKDLLSTDVQILTHTNATRRRINKEIRALVETLPKQQHRFAVGEKITFNSNKYLAEEEQGSAGGSGDVQMDYQQLRADSERGVKRDRFTFDYESGAEIQQRQEEAFAAATGIGGAPPPKKKARTDKWRGTDCDNVFNGDVKQISGIVDVDKGGKVAGTRENTDSKPFPRGTTRMIVFTDNEQLALDKYEAQQIESAIGLTVPKFQGSEVPRVIYWYEPNGHVRRDQFHTFSTRGQRQAIWIGGKTIRAALHNIETVVAANPSLRRERFAYHLDIEPKC